MKDEVRWHGSREKEVCPVGTKTILAGKSLTTDSLQAPTLFHFRVSRGAALYGVPPMEGFREGFMVYGGI